MRKKRRRILKIFTPNPSDVTLRAFQRNEDLMPREEADCVIIIWVHAGITSSEVTLVKGDSSYSLICGKESPKT